MARSVAKNAHKVNPAVRGPFDRVRTAVCYDPEAGLTHQSFKDECDINRIVETYARTGVLPQRRMEPIYGDAPDATLFEAACAQAEISSAFEDGFTPSEAPEAPEEASEPSAPEEAEKPLEAAPEGADA